MKKTCTLSGCKSYGEHTHIIKPYSIDQILEYIEKRIADLNEEYCNSNDEYAQTRLLEAKKLRDDIGLMPTTKDTEGELKLTPQENLGDHIHSGEISARAGSPEGEKELRDKFLGKFGNVFEYIEPDYKDTIIDGIPLWKLKEILFDFFLSEFKALEARKEGEMEEIKQSYIKLGKQETEVALTTFKNSVREMIKEKGQQQDDDTIWCNMDDLLNDPLFQ